MTREEILETLKHYDGAITERKDLIIFENVNKLMQQENVFNEETKHFEFVERFKKVICHFEFNFENDNFSGEERTFSIIGGFSRSLADLTIEQLKEYLEQYGFEYKELYQGSIFDL